MKHIFFFLGMLGFLSMTGQTNTFSLDGAIQYALQNNLQVRNAELDVADAEARIIENRATGLPQVSLGGNYQYFLSIPTSLVPAQFFDPNAPEGTFAKLKFGTDNNLTLQAQASTLLFNGSYLVGLKAAKQYRSYVDNAMTQTKVSIKEAVIAAYLPSLIIDTNLDLLNKNIANLEKVRYETQKIFEAGFTEQLDVDRLDLSIANLRTEQEALLEQKKTVVNALKFSMGYPLEEELILEDDLKKLAAGMDASLPLQEINFSSRPEYGVIEQGIKLSELNIKLQKAGYLPTLSAFGNYQRQMQGNTGGPYSWFPISIVGLQLNVPVFDGFDKKAKIQRAQIALDKTLNEKKNFERGVMLQVVNARIDYANAKNRLDSQQGNMALAEKIYNTTQIKFREGVGSSLEMTQAEQGLYTSQQNYLKSLYDVLTASVNLSKALGTQL